MLVLLWLLSNKSPPDGKIQLKQNIWAPSGVLSPHDLVQSELGSEQIVNLSQVFGQIRAGLSDWLSLMLNSEVGRRHLKMIPLFSLTFILAITAIKGAAAQNATDTNQVRSVQCRRYGTYDIIYIYDNICDIIYILSHICDIIHTLSHICDMKTDQVIEGSITSTDCLAYVYVTWIYFVYRYFLLCALCFV